MTSSDPAVLEWEDRDGIALIWLDNPPVNALDRRTLDAIALTVKEVEASDVRGAVITGRGNVFSAGADLYAVLEGGNEYIQSSVQALADAFSGLFRFSKPLVAAINGHAIAGGCIIAGACDYRVVGSGPALMGFAELRVGVPFPLYALEIARWVTEPRYLQEVVYFGRTYEPAEALKRGLADEIVEPDAVLDRAFEVARRLARVPAKTFAVTKRALRQPTVEFVESFGPINDEDAKLMWASDEMRESIRDFLVSVLGSAER